MVKTSGKARIALALVGIGAALVIGELGARLLFPRNAINRYAFDPQLGHRRPASEEGEYVTPEFHTTLRFNSSGVRDVERSIEKPPGTIRIAVLGDSFVEAAQVNEDKRFTNLLEQTLQKRITDGTLHCEGDSITRVEVLNFGVSGYGTTQELLMFETVAKSYKPDLVVLAFLASNDVQNNSLELETGYLNTTNSYRPYALEKDDSLVIQPPSETSAAYLERKKLSHRILDQSALIGFLYRRLAASPTGSQLLFRMGLLSESNLVHGAGERASFNLYLEPQPEVWNRGWHITAFLLKNLAAAVADSGADFMVINIPHRAQVVDPEWYALVKQYRSELSPTQELNRLLPNERLEQLAATIGLRSLFDITPNFQLAARDVNIKPLYFAIDGHLTEEGHFRLTEQFAKAFQCQASRGFNGNKKKVSKIPRVM